MSTDSRHPAAFTLIELLAVLVLLSFVAGLTAGGIWTIAEEASIQDIQGRLKALDRGARLHARSHGRAQLLYSDHTRRVIVWVSDETKPLMSLQIPSGTKLWLSTDSQSIEFDRNGRCADYAVNLVSSDRTLSWQVNGRTGYVSNERRGSGALQ